MRLMPKHGWWWKIVAWFVGAAFAGGVGYPLYVAVGDAYQELLTRLAAVAILVIVIQQLQKTLRRRFDGEPPSPFDQAAKPQERVTNIDRHAQALRAEVLSSKRSRRHFDSVLWPRLLALAERQRVTLTPPPTRWPAARGPTLSTIAKLISSIERKT